MKYVLKFASFFLVLIACSLYTFTGRAGIAVDANGSLQDKFSVLWDKYADRLDQDDPKYPHRIFYDSNDEIDALVNSAWKYKNRTYELYYNDTVKLARHIYNIAIFTNDITKEVSLERFEKGIQGFHYSIDQICSWINSKSIDIFTYDELQLVLYLIADGIIVLKDGKFISAGKVNHILGVAPGKKRSMKTVSSHERLHVIWDEDADLKNEYTQKWRALSQADKDKVVSSLKGYSLSKEEQLIEEWFVRELENSYFN
ncbi:MAG: hypothetical protein LBP22_07100 [Deltaproteobacteria bacterium]|jgi:hypothetical protein|nr:hypothetical protein [Deltaproteobacteria bacterium]